MDNVFECGHCHKEITSGVQSHQRDSSGSYPVICVDCANAELETAKVVKRLRESIGRLMHESWSRTKRVQGFHGRDEKCERPTVIGLIGFTCGERDSYGILGYCGEFHPDLLPWEELPIEKQQINMCFVDDLLAKYDLIPKGEKLCL